MGCPDGRPGPQTRAVPMRTSRKASAARASRNLNVPYGWLTVSIFHYFHRNERSQWPTSLILLIKNTTFNQVVVGSIPTGLTMKTRA